MGIISFACKIGIMAYAIDWIMRHNQGQQSGRATPVFHCNPTTIEADHVPVIHARELKNGRIGLEVDIPGMAKENLTMAVNESDRVIVLSGNKHGNEKEGTKDRHFKIKIALPQSADISDIHAAMDNGVLKVDVGKKAFEGSFIHIE